jgi:beta-glucanase (GH16 family)
MGGGSTSATGGGSSSTMGGGSAASGGGTSSGTGGGAATCSGGQIGTPPDCFPAPPAAAAQGKTWKMLFHEEFDGTDYDHTKLSPCFDWNSGGCTSSFNNGYEHYEPSQVQVANGIGRLVAEPLSPSLSDSACYQGHCTYKSGLLSTCRPNTSSPYLFTFKYGYVEAKLKIPGTQGFFTAFWMLPDDPTYSYNTEIDILEALGSDPTDMEMHYSYNNRSMSYTPNYSSAGKNGACADLDYSTGFHTFGVDWTAEHVAFYIDGTLCGQFTDTTQVPKTNMQIILNHMVSVDWERSVGKPLLDTTLTRELDVDYLRVYEAQ